MAPADRSLLGCVVALAPQISSTTKAVASMSVSMRVVLPSGGEPDLCDEHYKAVIAGGGPSAR